MFLKNDNMKMITIEMTNLHFGIQESSNRPLI